MGRLASLSGFKNFDNRDTYEEQEHAVLTANDGNFVIEWNDNDAFSALDLDEDSLQKVLQLEPEKATRWINIWGPERHRGMVKRLSARYDFSPRLLGIMCSDQSKPTHIPSSPQHSGNRWGRLIASPRHTPISSPISDPEKYSNASAADTAQDTLDINHYNMVNEVWHYCSVDWGKKYLCIGYNSLSDPTSTLKAHEMDDDDQSGREDEESVSNKPHGIRKWTWLVLCDDGTVISIYETPFPYAKGALSKKEQLLLRVIRRNLHNVFKQLSKVNDQSRRRNAIDTLDIRPGLSSNLAVGQSSKVKIADSSSLLFYYLFDDWYATYALVAKKEHQYAQRLEKLRKDMFEKPDIILVNRMHQYGRELAVLKRMYQSYALIIERILDRRKSIQPNSLRSTTSGTTLDHIVPDSNVSQQMSNECLATDDDIPEETQSFGAPLASLATVRFQRLLDRINLFAINEIQECLDEKESLVFLVFNLLALKESHAVERLTRVTILLAKVTILFMPVSLMTAYFSTQLIGLVDRYTIKTYWICFAVIMIVTFTLLLIFGQASDTVEGKPIYRTLERTAYDAVVRKFKARKAKTKRQDS